MWLPSITGLFIVIIIIYIYYVQFHHAKYPKIFLDTLIDDKYLKTGDLILLKAYDNLNSIITGSYFGHVGIIYVDPRDPLQIPMIFEANSTKNMALKPHHNYNGIFFSKLKDRIEKYNGRAFVKSLDKIIDDETIFEFREFIDYCIKNMKYEDQVIKAAAKKYFGLEKCTKKTNCGELTFLSLIKLGLLSPDRYEQCIAHYLKWMGNITKLDDGSNYSDLIEIVYHPFDQ